MIKVYNVLPSGLWAVSLVQIGLKLPFLTIVVTVSVIFFLTQFRTLNVMLMGDETATTLGISLSFYRKLYLTIASLITGIMVANCEMIGFIGLIIPHITRAIVGSNHKQLVPISVIFGGIFMVLTDLVARSIIPGVEIPGGIITAAIGAPVFLYMLLKKNYGFGGAELLINKLWDQTTKKILI